MKSLHISIIAGGTIALGMLLVFIMINSYNDSSTTHTGPVGAVSDLPLEFTDVTTEPKIVTAGNAFQIYATVKNPNMWPITFYDGCTSPLTISFDKNVQIQHEIGCYAISSQTINAGQIARVHAPSSGILYNATDIGTVNATIVFSYENKGNALNITTSKQIEIQAPVSPSPAGGQPGVAGTYVNPENYSMGIKLDCTKPIGPQMKAIDASVDVQKAINLAYGSPEFVSKISKYGAVHYNSFFNDWAAGDPCNTVWKSVKVVFSTNATGTARNIQVTEDVDLTRVLDVTDYETGFAK